MLCEHWNIAPCVECDVAPLKAENETLREANETLMARVAELSELVSEARDLFEDILDGSYKPDSFTSQPYKLAMLRDISRSWLMHKQAEAVDGTVDSCDLLFADNIGDQVIRVSDILDYAQRLHQQADEPQLNPMGHLSSSQRI